MSTMSSLLDPFGLMSSFTSKPAYTNPATAAMPYLQQVPGTISPYYQPFINTGTSAMNDFFKQVQQLGTPGGASDIYNQFASGYQTSPGTQYMIDTSTKQANQVAASSGMFGTPTEQQAVSATTMGLSNQDFNNYMTQMMGLYSTGLKGEEGLTHLGYEASSELGSDLAKNLMSEAGLEYAGTQGQNMFNAQQSNQMMQLLGSLLGLGGAAMTKL